MPGTVPGAAPGVSELLSGERSSLRKEVGPGEGVERGRSVECGGGGGGGLSIWLLAEASHRRSGLIAGQDSGEEHRGGVGAVA